MRKVLRGYAKDKTGNLILIGAMPVPLVRTNALRLLGGKKDIWSGKAQRYLRKKLFVSHPRTLGAGFGKAAGDNLATRASLQDALHAI